MVFMISQPMRGLNSKDILETRAKAVEKLRSKGHEVLSQEDVSTLLGNDLSPAKMAILGIKNTSVYWLSESLDLMSRCDGVYFCDGWNDGDHPGCQIEYAVALTYGLEMKFESGGPCNLFIQRAIDATPDD